MSTFVNGKGGGITDIAAFRAALALAPAFGGVEDLRDFEIVNVATGTAVSVAYHTIPADSGMGIFLWLATSEEDDNDGTVICPTGRTDPGRWVRSERVLNPAFVDIRWFGARRDDSTFDNGPAINGAIQSLPLYSGSYDLIINGGFMRNGSCFVPSGQWYTQQTIVASGGMRLFGEGPAKSSIVLKANSTGFTSATPKTLSAVSIPSSGLVNLTVTGHGVPVGNLTSGWIDGVSGTNSNYLNTWWRLKAIDANTLQAQWTGSGSYTVSSATVDLDAWVVDFQIDTYEISVNNVFGSVIEGIQIFGNAATGGNAGCSGLCIAGAQSSYARDVTVADTGKINSACDVSADAYWAANSIKGPGFMQTMGPCFENGRVHSEHHNQGGLYTMRLASGQVVPRPEFYIRGSSGTSFRQVQGEDSPWGVVIDGAVRVTIDLFNFNGPGVTDRNGWQTTLLYIAGDSYEHDFSKTNFQGVFAALVNDQSLLAISQSDAGVKTDFSSVMRRNGGFRYASAFAFLGPFANDAAAATGNVPVGSPYKVTGGTIAWRQS